MSTQVSNSFVKQFEKDVHLQFQQKGSKLMNTVRRKAGIVGSSTTFQKIGTGTATQKSRHGQVPPMNADHTAIECTLQDWYAGDWVDKLDENKLSIDERDALVQTGVRALGRKADELITTAMDATTVSAATTDGGLTLPKVKEALEILGDNQAFEGDMWAIVGFKQWNDLLGIQEFANSDFVSADDLPFKSGIEAKRWLNTIWMPHPNLPLSGTDRSCFWYNALGVGLASGADVTSDITWHGDHAAWFVNNWISMGSCLIDDAGVVRIVCSEA